MIQRCRSRPLLMRVLLVLRVVCVIGLMRDSLIRRLLWRQGSSLMALVRLIRAWRWYRVLLRIILMRRRCSASVHFLVLFRLARFLVMRLLLDSLLLARASPSRRRRSLLRSLVWSQSGLLCGRSVARYGIRFLVLVSRIIALMITISRCITLTLL